MGGSADWKEERMGLYKLCDHRGRARDRCEHQWWGCFRGRRVSLEKWANREIRNKDEATSVLEQLRQAVREGTFDERGLQPPCESDLTFAKLAERYKERHVAARKLALARSIDYRLKPILQRFGDRELSAIKTADIEDFIADLQRPAATGRKQGRVLSPASVNRTIELMRHMMNWAVGREYIERTPFRRGTETLIRKLREDNQRRRRLTELEEARLLAAAPPLLRSMIIAALDTGMRRGEMLALRFADIDFKRGLIVLRGATTKSGKTRLVPIATERLRAVLEWLQLDAAGDKKPAEARVFSNEIGDPVGSFRTAWVNTVLKAHDVEVKWVKGSGWRNLATACHEAFRRIDLHFHDIRHEYASRLVERGVPLAQVRDLLGHASITTTERYDNQKLETLQAAAARLEAGKVFLVPAPPEKVKEAGQRSRKPCPGSHRGPAKQRRPAPLNAEHAAADVSGAGDVGPEPSTASRARGADPGLAVCQVFVKITEPGAGDPRTDECQKTSAKDLKGNDLSSWLGGRDLNPDNVVQRAVNVRRLVLFRSGLLRVSGPALRFAPVGSGVFLCRVSHCVSGYGAPGLASVRSRPVRSSGQAFMPTCLAAVQSCVSNVATMTSVPTDSCHVRADAS
jgi:integrase